MSGSDLYTLAQLESAQTHDELWNAGQTQMVRHGWMHNYVRMYWAKKILEWTPDVATAMKYAIHLNDKYFLDGRDPNGYAGIAWAMLGKFDRAWGDASHVWEDSVHVRRFDGQEVRLEAIYRADGDTARNRARCLF